MNLRSLLLALCCLTTAPLLADDTPPAEKKEDQAERFKAFAERMNNVELVGQFTIIGQEKPPQKETYLIKSVKKLEEGDYWLITARIKYGDKDVTLPLPLEVKWAGSTPVITLDNFAIPGLGTFSSRVVLGEGLYAGTWKHGDVGGHLFGVLKKAEEE